MNFSKIIIALLFTVISCKKENPSKNNLADVDHYFQYITKIDWVENQDSISIKSGNEIIHFAKNDLPLKTAMVIPTSVISYLDELQLTDKISGISQPDYIFNPKIQSLLRENKLEEIATYNEIFVEKIWVNQPDIFITTSSPTLAKFHKLLKNQGITVLYIDEYLEENPLARAEYVKLFGRLFGKEKEAQELFNDIEKNYKEIQMKVQGNQIQKPTILANHMYGDIWYMPGGESYQAQLFKDAGGDYLWADNPSKSSLNLSFETVFEKAHEADVWLNAGDFPTLDAFIASYQNYTWFASVKNKKVYNWYKRTTLKGANDYFETGTVRPDWVLKDLAAILHPELFPKHELYFYKKLE